MNIEKGKRCILNGVPVELLMSNENGGGYALREIKDSGTKKLFFVDKDGICLVSGGEVKVDL